MKKNNFIYSTLTVLCLLSSCSVSFTNGNLKFSSTYINKIYYESQEVSLSQEKSIEFFNILDNQIWKKVGDNFSTKDFNYQISVDVIRTVSNSNDLYEKGDYNFVYYGNLETNTFYLNIATYSSFTQLSMTKINNKDLKAIKEIFKDYDINDKPSTENSYLLHIIDKDNLIYQVTPLSNNGRYIPGTIIKFYCYPIMDADLVMYIDDEYAGKYNCIEIGGNYIWEFSLTMPNHETSVRFDIQSTEYLSLASIYPWIDNINKDDIQMVLSYSSLGTICPTYYSLNSYNIGNQNDIETTYDFLKDAMVYKAQDPYWDGIGVKSLIIKMKNGESYVLSHIADGFTENGQYYEYLSSFPYFETYYANSFLYHCSFSLYNEENMVKEDVLEMRQIIFSSNVDADYIQDSKFLPYTIRMGDEKIYIINDSTFYLLNNDGKKVYQIINDFTFSDMLGISESNN